MSKPGWETLGIASQLDEIVRLLRAGRRQHQALSHANLLLTQLLGLIRPHRSAADGPTSPRTYYPAVEAGLPREQVRRLAELMWDAVRDIERGDLRSATGIVDDACGVWSRVETDLREETSNQSVLVA